MMKTFIDGANTLTVSLAELGIRAGDFRIDEIKLERIAREKAKSILQDSSKRMIIKFLDEIEN